MTEKKNTTTPKRTAQAKSKTDKRRARTDTKNQTPTRRRTQTGPHKLTVTQKREQEVHHAKVMIACGVIAALVLLLLVFALPRLANRTVNKGSLTGVNADVLQYEDKVAAYCKEYGISQFSTLMMAIMQQESSGQGADVFQCSESPFNTEYSNEPNSITDVDYSIRVGVETFAYCLEQAGCKKISDMDKVKVALQEYNFGNDYAGWALANYGGYSLENAYEFSEKMKAQLGWSSYGDPEYVNHVLQYYNS